MRNKDKKIWILMGLGDLILINLGFLSSYYFFRDTFDLTPHYGFLLLVFNFSWVFVSIIFKLYNVSRVDYIESIIYNIIKAGLTHILIIVLILFGFEKIGFNRQILFLAYVLDFGSIILWRFTALYFIKRYRLSGYNYQRVIIVGTGNVAKQLFDFFQSKYGHGFHIMSVFSDKQINDTKDFESVPILPIKDLESYCLDNRVDEIYYALKTDPDDILHKIISFSDKNMIRLRILPDFRGFLFRKVHISFYGSIPVITLRDEPLQDDINRMYKRVFDILFSLFVILLIFPFVFILMSLFIKVSSRGPIFFKQVRSGVNNKDFICYKFRSMEVNKEADNLQATKNDVRVTRIGRFMRKTNIDEFPQFFNVLLGDMSIVGPRPHMVKHTNEYSELIEDYMVRQLVKPGITGAAQVYGFRGETKTTEEMRKRVEYDIWYLENWSLLLDVKLIVLTVWNMLKGQRKAY